MVRTAAPTTATPATPRPTTLPPTYAVAAARCMQTRRTLSHAVAIRVHLHARACSEAVWRVASWMRYRTTERALNSALCCGALEFVGVQANTICHSPTDGVAQLGCSIVRTPALLLREWADRTMPCDYVEVARPCSRIWSMQALSDGHPDGLSHSSALFAWRASQFCAHTSSHPGGPVSRRPPATGISGPC